VLPFLEQGFGFLDPLFGQGLIGGEGGLEGWREGGKEEWREGREGGREGEWGETFLR